MIKTIVFVGLLFCAVGVLQAGPLTDYVNPFLGTATLWDSNDIGYTPTHRTWGAEVFPGTSVPNAMVQLSPVTQFRSGSGYQYEDTTIQAFTHTSKGHWNLCHIPLLPAIGNITPDDYSSPYSHKNESARPGYYQVYLERYEVNAELTSTLRCGFHRYTFKAGQGKKLIVDLSVSNERVRGRELEQEGETVFKGFQRTGEKMYFYAVCNHTLQKIETLEKRQRGSLSVVHFADSPKPLEIKIGFSFVSIENAKENLEKEIAGKSFEQVRQSATAAWESLLSKIQVTGGTQRQRGLFYSCLYRSFLWPALRSDANGEFTDRNGTVVNKGFRYYTEPSLWDDYRNKLVLLGMLTPDVSADVIQSLIDRGEKTGFMPTFFHGDHAAPYIAGTYLRGIRGYDIKSAYALLLRNATVEGRSRPFLSEYMEKGFISEPDLENPGIETKARAGVTKTLEYAYDDYAVALLAKELNDPNYAMLMKRSGNYKNMFDPSTGLMRGRLANGDWIKKFDPEFPYYEYMYREANAWQSSFFAPHDPKGLIALYPSPKDFEKKLDDLFSIPWKGIEAYNFSVFIGQYCHGNQPDHGFPYMYYFVGKQEKCQALLNRIMDRFYDMGKEKLAYAGMDDAGEMSSWYVFNAMGIYPFSPADTEYIVTVPLFEQVVIAPGDKVQCTIVRKNAGTKISGITYDNRKIDGYFISHRELMKGGKLVITTQGN